MNDGANRLGRMREFGSTQQPGARETVVNAVLLHLFTGQRRKAERTSQTHFDAFLTKIRLELLRIRDRLVGINDRSSAYIA